MKISVFGLGYVGTVSAGCLAREGHEVIGVDPVSVKVSLINRGESPIVEAEIGEIIAAAVEEGRLRATSDAVEAVLSTDISFVCVGTPSQSNGNLDLRYIRRICGELGEALKNKAGRHTIAIRSTILPGTMRQIVIPILEEASGRRAGSDFDVCHNPEFLREGSAVKDFRLPPKTVIGELNPSSGDLLAKLFWHLPAPLVRTDLETAEMVKYIDNSWHALKVGFANEIGSICESVHVNPHSVMEIFCQDTKLNLSSAYLRPGFAFGGSCLPKDLRALSYHAKTCDLEVPILTSILRSNEQHVLRALNLITEQGHRRIGLLGLSFKPGTDDLRESPIVELVERLIGKGYDIRIYDENVKGAALMGGNRDFILNRIPHLFRLLTADIDAVLQHAETVVIGYNDPAFSRACEQLRPGQVLIDLARGSGRAVREEEHYALYAGQHA